MDPFETLAIGLELKLVPTAEGGRQTPLLGGSEASSRFTYRPNWGLPGWANGEQTAAPVLGFSRSDIRPGDAVRAVAVPLFPAEMPAWRAVAVGDTLRMYEGSRICGRGLITWLAPTTWPMPVEEQERFAQGLAE